MQQEKKYMWNGLMGTIIFHLALLSAFFIFKLGDVKSEHRDLIAIELSEEPFKSIEQIIEESKPEISEPEPLSQKALSNIASNTAEKLNEKINTDKYIEEVMKELGMEEINPKYDNSLPDDPALQPEQKKETKKEKIVYNFGASRISYDIADKRSHSYMDRPIYKCQGGGTVVVKIAIDQEGQVLDAKIASSTTSDECLTETALNSARAWFFQSNYNSPKRVEGTIQYVFVAQ